MICHLPHNPLHIHGKQVLLSGRSSGKSWFQQIRDICMLYGLDHPHYLLVNPPPKSQFKKLVAKKITEHWEHIFKEEAIQLSSLQYFIPANSTLTTPHPVWSTAVTSSFETRKATVLARMVSGRFRSDYMARHWSGNRQGFCLAHTCNQTVGDLKHLLIQCPALAPVRQRMWDMFFTKSVQFPALLHFLQWLEKSSPETQLQFLLDPTAFQEIWEIWELFGQPAFNHVYYLTRTYAYYLYRQRQIMAGFWTTDRLIINSTKRQKGPSFNKNNKITNHSLIAGSDGVSAYSSAPDNSHHAPAVQDTPDPGQAA